LGALKQILGALLGAVGEQAPKLPKAAAGALGRIASALTTGRAAIGMIGAGLPLVFSQGFTPSALFAAKCVFLACAAAYVMHRMKGDAE
jgi:hypothetical protein